MGGARGPPLAHLPSPPLLPRRRDAARVCGIRWKCRTENWARRRTPFSLLKPPTDSPGSLGVESGRGFLCSAGRSTTERVLAERSTLRDDRTRIRSPFAHLPKLPRLLPQRLRIRGRPRPRLRPRDAITPRRIGWSNACACHLAANLGCGYHDLKERVASALGVDLGRTS